MAPKDIMTNTHAKSILNSMNSLRKSNTLCDVTLRVEQKDFPAHRIVLAACSDYFCAMFTSELSEKGKPYVDIQGLTASTMEILLDFVYTETVHVTVENVQELLPAACLLQLKGVKQACCEFLESQLDPSNCLGIRDFAETHNCVDLMQAAEVFSQKHFPEVVQHEEFILLSQGEVEKLIKCDEIQVDSEEPVFEAVISWVKHAKKEREGSLPDLLQYVRMPLLTPRYITDVIDTEPFIRCSLQCRDLVDEAKKFHLRPELRTQMQGPRTRARLGKLASRVRCAIWSKALCHPDLEFLETKGIVPSSSCGCWEGKRRYGGKALYKCQVLGGVSPSCISAYWGPVG